MLELAADKELCKGCACVVKMPCFIAQHTQKSIMISRIRLETDEEIQAAVTAVIAACPLKAVELRTRSGVKAL